MNTDRARVVVTGMGAVTPLGSSVEQFWDGLVAGRSGIGPITLCDTTGYPTRIAGEIPDFQPDKYINSREARRMARFSQVSLAAAYMAMEDASLDLEREDSERIGVLLGNGAGGLSTNPGRLRRHDRQGRHAHQPVLHPHDAAQHGSG